MKKIAYLGPAGSFSEQAAIERCNSCEYVPVESIPMVASVVAAGGAEEGVVPIENSIEGAVTFTVDLLIHDSDLMITGETIVPIKQCLSAKDTVSLEDIEVVFSHPQSLSQCREYLGRNLPQAELVASLSNSKAVEEMKNSLARAAAISSQRAANINNVVVLRTGIEDFSNNQTRFVILSRVDSLPTGDDKTSLCFEFYDDSPGILSNVLTEFASRGINLEKIESRPTKKRLGLYVFLLDIQGHKQDAPVLQAVEALKSQVGMLKILGSYPKHRTLLEQK